MASGRKNLFSFGKGGQRKNSVSPVKVCVKNNAEESES